MPHRRIPLIFASIFITAAVCINLSWIHGRHDADSLLMSLISIEQWTPYYWGDNRFGTLLPLVASVVRSYIPNLLVQTQLSICAALLTVVLFQCFFLDRERGFTARNLSFRLFDRGTRNRRVPAARSRSSGVHAPIAPILHVAVARARRTDCASAIWRSPALRYSIAAIALLLSFWVNWTNGPVIVGLALLLPSDAKN